MKILYNNISVIISEKHIQIYFETQINLNDLAKIYFIIVIIFLILIKIYTHYNPTRTNMIYSKTLSRVQITRAI